MIYVDTSVVLAYVLAEPTRPPPSLWQVSELVSSRLTDYEAWVRLNAYGKTASHGGTLARTLAVLDLLALSERTCARCRGPFPVPVRSLDALHLAAADYLRTRGYQVSVATYDDCMRAAAQAMGFPLTELDTAC